MFNNNLYILKGLVHYCATIYLQKIILREIVIEFL